MPRWLTIFCIRRRSGQSLDGLVGERRRLATDLRVSSTQVSEVPPMRPEANREACEQIRANFKSRLFSPKVGLCYELDCQRPGRNQSVDVSYLAQTLDGQRRKRITIDTPSQGAMSHLFVEHCETVAAGIDIKRRRLGKQ